MKTAEVYQPPKAIMPERADRSNAELQQRIRRFLGTRRIRDLENIHVDVDGGTVVLRGLVASPHDRWLCVNCSGRVAGVLRVVDELENGDDAPRIKRPR